MASQSLPIPTQQAHKQSRTRAFVHAPSLPLRAAAIAFVAVIILFRWLHLIVSLQVASTDRQIQMGADVLGKYERANAALQRSIAEAASPRSLAFRAHQLGYQARTPAYVPSDQPLLPADSEGAIPASGADQELPGLFAPAASQSDSNRASNLRPEVQTSPYHPESP